jgi:hypothetical protein
LAQIGEVPRQVLVGHLTQRAFDLVLERVDALFQALLPIGLFALGRWAELLRRVLRLSFPATTRHGTER